MFCTVNTCSRNLLFWLLCFCMAPLFAQDQQSDQLQRAVPGELHAEIGVGNGLVLSADGRWLLFSSTAGLGLIDLDTDEIQGVGDLNEHWHALDGFFGMAYSSWSPVEPHVAFNLYREGRWFLCIWSPNTERPRQLLAIPRDMSSTSLPIWSSDGKTLYVLVSQHLPWPKSHPDDDYPPTKSENVELRITEHYGENIKRRRFEKEYEEAYAERRRSLIMAIDVATGRAGLLAKGNDISGLYLSPDNQYLVALQTKIQMPDKRLEWTKQVLADMYLLDTAQVTELPTIDLEAMDDRRAGWFDYTGQRLTPVLTDVHLNQQHMRLDVLSRVFGANGNRQLSWSPDSRRFAYATVGRQSQGDVFTYDIASSRLRNLTKGIKLAESSKSLGYGDHYTWPHNSLKFGNLYPPLWLPDGKSLVAVGRGDVWQIFLNPKKKPQQVTRDLPQEVRRVIPSYLQNIASVDSNGRLILVAKERESRMDSLWKLDVKKRRSEKLADTGVWINPSVVTDLKGQKLVYTGQAPQAPKNIYQIANGEKPELVTRYRLHLMDRRYPESRVLKWRTSNGEARGLLYLPDGVSESNQAPMILYGYPGQVDAREDHRAKRGLSFFDDALYGLLQDGFAVLYPDIELSDEGVYERPMFQIVEAVEGATKAALATGLIDADRLGIMGGSYGGYMTQAVIAQTDHFKAAVSMYGLADLYGDYSGGGDVSLQWSEIGQGRLEVPPWKDPKRYTDNSPLSYFDQVKTPLLLIHGEGDQRVPVELSRQSFRALKRLKNPTVFARYRRLGHNRTQEVDLRARLWFRQHLLDGRAVAGQADQGSFFLGGDLAQDKLATEAENTSEEQQ